MSPGRLALSELLNVQKYLENKGLNFITPRLISPASGVLIIEVARDRIKGVASTGQTSRRQLSFLSKSLATKFERRVLITIRDSQSLDDVAASLRAVLRHQFPDLITDIHVSFENAGSALVWLETASIVDSTTLDTARAVVRSELAKFTITCKSVEVIAKQLPEPSMVAVLRSVKVLAPASISSLAEDLVRRGFAIPSEKWLAHKLDLVRKRGLALRDLLGRYSLTSEGLGVVPKSRSKSSSDVERMLALARRKEW